MRAWTVDADDIEIAEDLNANLVLRTNAIDEFLDPGRSEKFIVTGTKGFGKTLLLKAKRLGLEKRAFCIPENSLLDKPVGDHIFSSDTAALLGESTRPWCIVWLISIVAAVLKQADLVRDLDLNPRLASLLRDSNLRGAIDHFVNVLQFQRNELFESGNDTNAQLIPRLRRLGRPMAVFIDSVDEYFNKHIQMPRPRASEAGVVSPNIWYFSQMALVEVAYQLRRTTHHLKVFAAVRKEAFARLAHDNAMIQQYRGSIVDLSYRKADLQEIFVRNIRSERERNLAEPGKLRNVPIEAFLGAGEWPHTYTGEVESAFDYVYRHTLMRPRDLMSIGSRLSRIAPAERSRIPTLKAVVNRAATEIAQAYLAEIRPYVGDVDFEAFWRLLPGHVLSADDVESVADEYDAQALCKGHTECPNGRQVFAMLYVTGLLGHVYDDLAAGCMVQRFLAPGEAIFDLSTPLPASSCYLIHPCLAEVIARGNADYARTIHRVNVIGHGRVWHAERAGDADRSTRETFVLAADIEGFGTYMEDGKSDVEIRARLTDALEAHASGCLAWEHHGGDAVWVVHDDVCELVDAGIRIMQDMRRGPRRPQLRLAIVRGPVRLRTGEEGRVAIMGGDALRIAARIQPHVTPGQIWATEAVRAAVDVDGSLYTAVHVQPPGASAAARDPACFNVKKQTSREHDIVVKLYRVVQR